MNSAFVTVPGALFGGGLLSIRAIVVGRGIIPFEPALLRQSDRAYETAFLEAPIDLGVRETALDELGAKAAMRRRHDGGATCLGPDNVDAIGGAVRPYGPGQIDGPGIGRQRAVLACVDPELMQQGSNSDHLGWRQDHERAVDPDALGEVVTGNGELGRRKLCKRGAAPAQARGDARPPKPASGR